MTPGSPQRFYDVVLLGTQLGALLTGALLAKRGFRVLLIGQDDLPATYELDGMQLPRQPFTFLAEHSPVTTKIMSELALYQTVRRRAQMNDPALQVSLAKHRFEAPRDEQYFDREIAREFPEVKRPVEDFHEHIGRISKDLDRLVKRDLVWPPETFFERREFSRGASGLPFGRNGNAFDPLSEFPESHAFRTAVDAPVRFASGLDPDQLSKVGAARLYAAWRRSAFHLEGGEAELTDLVLERLRTYSGEIQPRTRADRILTRHGTAVGIRLAGSGETIGCAFVIANCTVAKLRRLVQDAAGFGELFERFGEPQARWFRYTLNAVVDAEGVPEGMKSDVFVVHEQPSAQRMTHVRLYPKDSAGRRLLCVQALLPRRVVEDVSGQLATVRPRLLDSLREVIPFLDQHLLWVDSPHDGRDAEHVPSGQLHPPADPFSRGPTTMRAIFGYPVLGPLGVTAMPIRTPIRRLLVCNDQVVPGLGMEGTFLAAWSAARIVTRSDRRKKWMRRGLWTKVEI